jgi:hypothetical protein
MVIPDSTQHPVKRGAHQEVKAVAAEKSMQDAGSQSVSTDELNSGHFLGFAKHLVTVGNWTFEMDSPGNLHNELEHFRRTVRTHQAQRLQEFDIIPVQQSHQVVDFTP